MAIESSKPISIRTASGTNRSINAEMTTVDSGSLVALSTNAIESAGYTDLNDAPYGMSEFLGYAHTWSTTGIVDEVVEGKTTRWVLELVDSTPDNVGGTLNNVLTYPGGTGLRLQWASLNTGWTSVKLGATEGSATTLARSAMTADGNTHYIADGNTYITNTDNASMYFELIA
jgi:hypothetical protein